MSKVLIVDDDKNIRQVLTQYLEELSYEVVACETLGAAIEVFANETLFAAIVDIRLGVDSGIDLLKIIAEDEDPIPVLVVTAEKTPENAMVSMREGAFNYITKPFDFDEVEAFVREAKRNATKADEVAVSTSNGNGSSQRKPAILVGVSPAMQDVFKAVGRVAPSEASVLINGESGTGKELVARAVHEHSKRKDGPFVAVNMAAIPTDLVEAELF